MINFRDYLKEHSYLKEHNYLKEQKIHESEEVEFEEIDFKELIGEAAPPSRKAKQWMIDNKEDYKEKYGEKWEGVLYSKAWDKFNDGEFGDPEDIKDKGEDLEDDELALNEATPPSDEAEKWIKDNKENFKDQYGDDYKEVLYATAWKMYNKGSFSESTEPATTTAGVANVEAPIELKKEKNFGYNCIVVDEETYSNLVSKEKNKHWNRYLQDSNNEFGKAIKKEYYKSQSLMMKNEKTGEMVFIK